MMLNCRDVRCKVVVKRCDESSRITYIMHTMAPTVWCFWHQFFENSDECISVNFYFYLKWLDIQ